MTLSKKQILITIFTFATLLAIPIAVFLTQREQNLGSRALAGKANFLLSTDSNTSTVGKDINVLVSVQLTDSALRVSGADFVLLYDKNLLDVGNIVPEITSVNPKAPFTDALLVTSGGSFDDKFNFVRVAEVARRKDADLPKGTVNLARITFRGRGLGGQAEIKFPDDDKYLEVVGTGSYVGPPTAGGPSITPGGPTLTPVPTVTPGGPTPTRTPSLPGLVGYWKMDETSGQTVADSSGKNNHGTATGTAIVAGKTGKGRNFNGSSDRVGIASNFGFGAVNTSIAMWVNIPSVPDKGAFMKIGGSGGYGIGMGDGDFDKGGNHLIMLYEGVRWMDTGKNIGLGWHHIAMVINDAGTATAYLDGTAVGAVAGSKARTPEVTASIGGYTVARIPRYFRGIIDEVQVYNRAISAGEVKNLYTRSTATGASAQQTSSPVSGGGGGSSEGPGDKKTAKEVALDEYKDAWREYEEARKAGKDTTELERRIDETNQRCNEAGCTKEEKNSP